MSSKRKLLVIMEGPKGFFRHIISSLVSLNYRRARGSLLVPSLDYVGATRFDSAVAPSYHVVSNRPWLSRVW